MERIEKTFEIKAPCQIVYNQWTQFEEFPRFMDGVKEVRQIDDTHLHWRASIAGKEKEWDAEITEHLDRARVDLEGHVELRERNVLVAQGGESSPEPVMKQRI